MLRLPISHETLSAYALMAYAKHGRGVVIAKEGEAFDSPSGPEIRTVLVYLAEGSELFEKSGGWPSDGVRRFVEEYDPSRECVLLEFDMLEGARATIVPLLPIL